MTDGEQRHIDDDVAHAVEKEDHAEDEQQMVVAGDHVLGAEIHEGEDVGALGGGDERGILAADAMGEGEVTWDHRAAPE